MKSSATHAGSSSMGFLVLTLLLSAPLLVHGFPGTSSTAQLGPTRPCACSSSQPASTSDGDNRFFPHPPPIFQNYDEQVGITFTQNFSSIEYNVTALAQTDPSLGVGPSYLVNGLTDAGYWYQVGVSWDWAPGENPGTGLDMNYEVWDNLGDSVFPVSGGGGLVAFSGPVKAGDIIVLDLYFAIGNVVMQAYDADTGASASESYSSEGASNFVGLPGSVANPNGYFTGLMTEWYHGLPYYANENTIIYSNPRSPLTSAWMWMDEFDASNSSLVFANATSSPVSFTAPAKFQEFSYNGTTEFADAFEFVTGALSNAIQSSSSVPLVLWFDVQGSATGSSPPVLNYVLNGMPQSVRLTSSPTLYFADKGTDWSVSSMLGGSGSTQRWETNQTVAGIATSLTSNALVYFEQEYVVFGFTVMGGGSGFSPPSVTYSSFGQNSSTPPSVEVWADFGSRYQYENPLPGSTLHERWFAESGGTISQTSRVSQISITYYNQYLVAFQLSFRNTEILPPVPLLSTSVGRTYSGTIVAGANMEWLDSGASYTVPQSFVLEAGQRFVTNGSYTGDVAGSVTVDLVYEHQFYERITADPPNGGTVSPTTGWYDSGMDLQLAAVPSETWQFEGWQGSGSDSVSGSQPSLSLIVGPGTPANETAVFYAGVTIQASGPSPVAYRDGSISGSVSGGTMSVVFVPPGSTMSLTASGVPSLTSFSGWRGASNSTSASIAISVSAPVTINGRSGYDILGVGGLVVVLAVTAAALTVLFRRRRAGHAGTTRPAQDQSPATGGESVPPAACTTHSPSAGNRRDPRNINYNPEGPSFETTSIEGKNGRSRAATGGFRGVARAGRRPRAVIVLLLRSIA